MRILKKDNVILLVDGTNLIHRNYYAHSYRRTKSGAHTGGIYGTIRSLQGYVDRFNPKQVYICFDKSEYTFRSKIYPDYKMNRKEIDVELLDQFLMLKEYCKIVNFPFIEIDLYEADDIIGSLACNAKDYNLHPLVISGDKDLLQLIPKGIDVFYLSNKGMIKYGEEEFEKEYGIQPEQFGDYKALVGDPSDNIPGIPGVGKKTASKLLNKYKTLEGIYEHINELKGKLKESILANKDNVFVFREILTIYCRMDLDYEDYFERYIDKGYKLEDSSLNEFLEKLEILE